MIGLPFAAGATQVSTALVRPAVAVGVAGADGTFATTSVVERVAV